MCDADGQVDEGLFADGKRNGHWVHRFATGTVAEGLYVDDKRNGQWAWRFTDGVVAEGLHIDGKLNGHWVWRHADGTVSSTNMTGETGTVGGMMPAIAELMGFLGLIVTFIFGFFSIASDHQPNFEHLWPLWLFLATAGVGFVRNYSPQFAIRPRDY